VKDARVRELVELKSAHLARAGPKAYASRRILELSRIPTAGFTAPDGFVIPFGVMEMVLDSDPRAGRQYQGLVDALNDAQGDALLETSRRLRELFLAVTPPQWLAELLDQSVDSDRRYVVRSSSNLEDLAGYSAAGLHDSVIGVSGRQVARAAMQVWASLHSPRAAIARRQANMAASDARMAVLVQPLILAEASFVMFTRSPLSRDCQRAYAEMAVGLGDVLTSGVGDGSPLRLEFDKSSGDHEIAAFPSYLDALQATPTHDPEWQVVRYARVPLVTSRDVRHRVVQKLVTAARTLEGALGGPQDVEGVLANDTLTIVQSRPAIAKA
jgi:pyruvate,water dikinase